MDTICPHCSRPNPENSVFCVGCGNRVPQSGQIANTGTGINASLPTLQSQGSGPTTLTPQPSYGPSPSSTYPGSAPYPSTSSPQYSTGSNPPTYAPGGSSSPPPYTPGTSSMPPPATQWSSAAVAPPPPASQFGSTQALASVRRAFAGHGQLIMHHSWLLPGDQAQAMAVRHGIQTKIGQRKIPQTTIAPTKLTERGLLMEEREYLIAQRGVTTVFIYATPAGSDLYISRATTVLPAVSNFRIILTAMLAIIMFIGFVDHPVASISPFGGVDSGYIFASFLNFLSFVILLFFIVMIVRSLIIWVLEKDFLRYLRPNTLNDFNIDDIMVLEHVTDDVVHSAVEQLGLDASKIAPPPQGYEPKQHIRAI
ncbi:MAG: hypothetical protein ABI406_19105 [Ktedonobacteraceae bacterium]